MKILKEGPGAGYSVSAAVAFRTIDDIKILDIKPEDDHVTVEFSCVAHGLANELKAKSYDYSVSLDAVDCEMTRGKITIPTTSLHKDILIDLIREEILECLIETKCNLGFGYSHVKYEGALAEIDSDDINSYDSFNSELLAANIYITDVKVINYIDSALQGENLSHSYEVLDDSYEVVSDTFGSFDDAREFAKLNNLNKIHDFVFETDIDGNAVYIDDDVITLQTESMHEGLDFGDDTDIIDMIDMLWPKEHLLEFATELEYKLKETTGDETVKITNVYIDDNILLHIIICTDNNCFEETVDLNSEFKDVYDLMSNGVEVLNKKFADRIISDNELWNEVHEDKFDLTENVIESATTFYNTYNMTVEEAVKKAVDICNDVHSEDNQDISYESILEAVKNKLDEGRNKPYGEMAYNLNEIISAMNNEEAYYGEWLYTWVDESTLDDAFEYFGDEDSYNDLLELFKEIYKEYHDDGLYTNSQRIINMAHSWDKKLGLDEIEVLTPNKI